MVFILIGTHKSLCSVLNFFNLLSALALVGYSAIEWIFEGDGGFSPVRGSDLDWYFPVSCLIGINALIKASDRPAGCSCKAISGMGLFLYLWGASLNGPTLSLTAFPVLISYFPAVTSYRGKLLFICLAAIVAAT